MKEQKSLLTELGEAIDRYRAGQQAAREERESNPSSTHSRGIHRFLRWLTPNGGTLLLVVVLILTQNVWAKRATATSSSGPSATTVNYQGRLADHGGTPLDGTYGMSFALYDAATDGTLIWGPETHAAVPVSNGLFSVGLGSQTSGGIPTTVWDGDRYLEITVGGETLSPRELIRSVPIAGMALTVPDGSITQEKLASPITKQSFSNYCLTFNSSYCDYSVSNYTDTPHGQNRLLSWTVPFTPFANEMISARGYLRISDNSQTIGYVPIAIRVSGSNLRCSAIVPDAYFNTVNSRMSLIVYGY